MANYLDAVARDYKSSEETGRVSTLANGQPSDNPGSVHQLRYGSTNGGLVTLADTQTIEILAHFARERIPERYVELKVLHSVTNPPTEVCMPKLLERLANLKSLRMYPTSLMLNS